MIDMSVIGDGQTVLAITENGYGKRTDPDEYREQGRNGMGMIAMRLSDKTGPLVAQLTVTETEDILLITDEGVIIRMAVDSINVIGRATQGVRLMRLDEGAKIVGIARAEQEEDEDELIAGDMDGETAAESSTDEISSKGRTGSINPSTNRGAAYRSSPVLMFTMINASYVPIVFCGYTRQT